jgi:hypothetical protein
MFPDRSRVFFSTLLAAAVLAVSILSGCVVCEVPGFAKTLPVQQACCNKHAQTPSCHMPVQKGPVTQDCQSHRIDLGSVEHSLQKSAPLDFVAFVEAPASFNAAMVGSAPQFEEGPPGLFVAATDLLSLNSAFRI